MFLNIYLESLVPLELSIYTRIALINIYKIRLDLNSQIKTLVIKIIIKYSQEAAVKACVAQRDENFIYEFGFSKYGG